jgi:hypothetical protein
MSAECSAPECDFAGAVDAVAGHIGGKTDDLHAGVVPDRIGDDPGSGDGLNLDVQAVVLVLGAALILFLVLSPSPAPEPQQEEDPLEEVYA